MNRKPNTKKNEKRIHHYVKVKNEKPLSVFLEWIKTELKTVKPGSEITLSLEKLIASVFRPAGITEPSAYLFMNRICQNRVVSVTELGTMVTNNKRDRSYTFVPHRKAAPKTEAVSPMNGNPPIQPHDAMLNHIRSVEAGVNLLLVGMNAMMKELGIDASKG